MGDLPLKFLLLVLVLLDSRLIGFLDDVSAGGFDLLDLAEFGVDLFVFLNEVATVFTLLDFGAML